MQAHAYCPNCRCRGCLADKPGTIIAPACGHTLIKERAMKRREFLISAVAIGAVASARRGWAQGAKQAKQSTLDRIAIMTLNFQRMLKLPDLPEGSERTLELFDVPQMIADRYGVHKVEFQHY